MVADNETFDVPDNINIEYKDGNAWKQVSLKDKSYTLIGNTGNEIDFDKVNASAIKINFTHKKNKSQFRRLNVIELLIAMHHHSSLCFI